MNDGLVQGDLFGAPPPPAPADARRAALRAGAARWAERGVLLGTSSWKYPGWLGWLYTEERYRTRGRHSQAKFERECLAEYAEVLPTVCVDAGYYTFPTREGMEKLCSQVPAAFRFGFKVTDEITLRRFPVLDRFGARGGSANPHFLDADLFRNAFLRPLEPFQANVGVLMFEFAAFQPDDWPEPAAFAAALDAFLRQLPAGWQYGVEIRNEALLTPEYFATLARHGVTHVFNHWHRMPGVERQLQLPGSLTTDFTAARFLLKPGRRYEDAVQRFSPYTHVQEERPEAREAAAALMRAVATDPASAPGPAEGRKRKSFVFINNRLEGNALETLLAIILRADEPADQRPE